MKINKLALIAALSLVLSGCFHIQLNGSVGGGQITIAPLRDPANILQSIESTGPADYVTLWGQEYWDSLESLFKLVFVGIANVTPTDLDPQALYLVTASGGLDYAPDAAPGLSDNPVEVLGEWHTIATGARLMAGNLKVSSLTEALYLQLKNRLGEYTDAEIVASLEAAAQLLVNNIDGKGGVNYDDLLLWNRTINAAAFRGDIADLDQLATAITAGQSEATLVELANNALPDLTLSASAHMHLNGPVGGGQLTIAPLRDPANIQQSIASMDPSAWAALLGQAYWDSLDSSFKQTLVGIANVTPTGLDPEALYLVTASGGLDYAPEVQPGLSDNPVNVQGEWHAIATGGRLMAGNLEVSSLTEALYLQLKNRLGEYTDAEIVARLEAAAQLVALDVDGNGTVDYNDALRWNATTDAAKYRGDSADLDQLASAITAGEPEDMLMALAVDALATQQVRLQTNFGTIEFETLNWDAPITVLNFLDYVQASFYDQVIFHRVINGFMIQTGIWEYLGENLVDAKVPNASIVNESSNGVSNQRGTLSMARTGDPDSAASQFFINQVDNTFLDYGSNESPDGYAVFARVTTGMDVVDTIAALQTTAVSGIGNDVPVQLVLIESVTLLE